MGNSDVSKSDLLQALDDLLAQEAPPRLEETDITVMSLARRAQIGCDRAKKLLAKWTDEGKTEAIGKRRDARGHLVEAWRLVKA